MKKLFLLSILLFTVCFFASAQKVELTPFGGYVFPTHWNGSNGSVHFDGNAQYGGMLSLKVSRVTDVDFIYNRIDTKAYADIAGYGYGETVGISENFYMLGVTKNFPVNEKVSPFLSFNMGGVYMAPKETDYYSYWFFALGIDGGAKIYLSKAIGIRLQAQLMMPLQGGGFSFYYGTGGGGTSAYLTAPLLNFGFTGGLIFRLGR